MIWYGCLFMLDWITWSKRWSQYLSGREGFYWVRISLSSSWSGSFWFGSSKRGSSSRPLLEFCQPLSASSSTSRARMNRFLRSLGSARSRSARSSFHLRFSVLSSVDFIRSVFVRFIFSIWSRVLPETIHFFVRQTVWLLSCRTREREDQRTTLLSFGNLGFKLICWIAWIFAGGR